MISEFRRMKILYLFHLLFDKDSSGTVNKTDFELAVDNIAKLRGWVKDDDKYKEVKATLYGIWDSLQKSADLNNDGEVTMTEWLNMWEEYSKDQTKQLEWQKLYCKFIFDLEDASGDGFIDKEEYTVVMESLGLLKDDADAAFGKMSKGNKNVSWSQFQELWNEYLTSEDSCDPGNFILGAATF